MRHRSIVKSENQMVYPWTQMHDDEKQHKKSAESLIFLFSFRQIKHSSIWGGPYIARVAHMLKLYVS